jgi:hypothetical protein
MCKKAASSGKSNSICNSLEDIEKIDNNFVYTNSNNLFSDFINFNLNENFNNKFDKNFMQNDTENYPSKHPLTEMTEKKQDKKDEMLGIKLVSKNDNMVNINLCYDNEIDVKFNHKIQILSDKKNLNNLNVTLNLI